MHASPTPASRTAWLIAAAAVVILGAVGQAWTLGNPGYYSHDELQWAARALDPAGAPLWDWRELQFRPLTFGLWMAMSRALFATPVAFHAAWVALGLLNALALLGLLRPLGARPGIAAAMTVGFVLGPYAAWTQAWVATLADLLWVGAALALAHVGVAATTWRPSRVVVLAALLTLAALLAKEAAIVLPALALLAAWLDARRTWRWVALGSALPCAVYLALRVGVILFGARPAGVYEWSLLAIPAQFWGYWVFPLAPSVPEIETLGRISGTHAALATALVIALAVALWRAGRGFAIAWVVGGALALGPVLILHVPANHYAYGFSAVTLATLALAWPRLPRWGRVLAGLVVFVGVWHGASIQRHVRDAGKRQAVFSPALAQAVAGARTLPLRLRNATRDPWLYERLTTDIPSYGGQPIGARVRLVGAGEPADLAIAPDGSLVPAK